MSQARPTDPSPAVDVERLTALLSALGPDALARLFAQAFDRLDTLAGELALSDRGALLGRLHTLRGSCASLGLAALAEHLARIWRDLDGADENGGRSEGDQALIAARPAWASEIGAMAAEAAAALAADGRTAAAARVHGCVLNR